MKIAICAIIKDEQRYLEEWLQYHFKLGFDEIYLYEDLENACKSYYDEHQLVDAVEFNLRNTPLEDKISSYDIWESLSKDYPINVKTITRIYVNEIIPFIRDNLL